MLVIRLKRIGRKNQAYFRIVLQEKTQAPPSGVIETLGSLNPNTNPAKIELKKERVEYWLKQGAQPSATVNNLLVNMGIIKGPKMKVVQPKKKEEEPKKEEAPKAKEEPAKEEAKPEEKKDANVTNETKDAKEEKKEETKPEEKKEEVAKPELDTKK